MDKIKVKKGDLVTLYNGVNGYISDLFKSNCTIEISSDSLVCGIYHIQNLKTVNGIATEYNDLDIE